MAALVTLAEVKADLNILNADRDTELTLKAELATDIVMGYIKKDADELYWDDETVPYRVKAAVLLVVRSLFNDDNADPLTEGVKAILHRDRDPALA